MLSFTRVPETGVVRAFRDDRQVASIIPVDGIWKVWVGTRTYTSTSLSRMKRWIRTNL